MPIKTYTSAVALRTALEGRLIQMSRKDGIDIMRLRRQFAFDRLLSRLFAGENDTIVLKGGYAIELRLSAARTTKDIDLCIKKTKGSLSTPGAVRDFINDRASLVLGDFVEFVVGEPSKELANAPYGGYRFPIEAGMAGRLFIKFSIDVATGDVWLGHNDRLQPRDWLGFAGIVSPDFPAITIEQQIAEKLHSYTMPRQTPNSRVKDLFDVILFLNNFKIDKKRMSEALSLTFKFRKTHPVPDSIVAPPDAWAKPYAALSQQSGIDGDIMVAYAQVADLWEKIDMR